MTSGHQSEIDVLIVGAGFAGSVCAERLSAAGKRVLLVDKRPHIGGNAFDKVDAQGVLIHVYGPHIFHTNSKRIFEYLSRFTMWRFYEHRVLSFVDGALYPMPINRTTINSLYNLSLDEEGVSKYLEGVREARDTIRTSEDVVLSAVGRDLCDRFFRGYTRKQWGLELSELASGVAARIPTRTNDDDRYFSDTFQFMPAAGYTPMFSRMLDHALIDVRLGMEYREIREQVPGAYVIFTGPIDEFYDYQFGKLPYRSLVFEHEQIQDADRYQQVGTINYPNDFRYTRVTEFKHLTGQHCKGTSIVREYSSSTGDPYYPIPRPENEALFKQYVALAKCEERTSFTGRLAEYRYYNMDQVVGAALKTAEVVLTKLS